MPRRQLQALPSIAAQRKLEPKRLTKLVAGELDWIVMKCLEKDRGPFRRENPALPGLAYVANMAPRLVELRRVLKRSGSIYLHYC